MFLSNWRQAWRWSSVRVAAIGAAITAFPLFAPDVALQVWQSLPADVVAHVPAKIGRWVETGLFAAMILARVTQLRGNRDDG